MTVSSLFFCLLSLGGSYSIGASLTKSTPAQSVVIGVLLQALVLSLTVWIAPNATTYLVAITQVFATIYIITYKTRTISQHLQILRDCVIHPKLYLALLVALIFAQPFSLYEYPFNSHDPVYWGYVFESLHADYSGPLRSPLFSPLELPVTHLLSMMSLTTVISFNPSPTLINIIQAKYLITVLFFWRAAWFLVGSASRELLPYAFALLICLLFFFESELGYNVMVSSYIYEIVLLEIFIILASQRKNLNLALIFFLTLIAARASLSFAAVGAAAVLAWHLRSKITWETYVFGGAVGANVLTWLMLPKPLVASANFLCSQAKLSFVNPLSFEEFGKLGAISDWALPSALTNLIYRFLDNLQQGFHIEDHELPHWTAGAFLVYVFLKFFLPVYLWGNWRFRQNQLDPQPLRNALLLYLVLLWCGMFLVRIGGAPDHQFHAFLVLTIISLAAIFEASIANKFLGALVVVIGVYGASHDGLYSQPFSSILSQGIQREAMRFETNEKWTYNGPHRLWHEEVELLAKGQRRNLNQISAETYQKYFNREPADIESIASLWLTPDASLSRSCE